jgi:hypothetical protein
MNGKLGGSCAARNRAGLYFKNWKVPRNPQSADQIKNRTSWKTLVKLWQTISDGQRSGWIALAKSLKHQNKLAKSFVPSGYNVFLSCNQNRSLLSLAPLSDAPTYPAIPQFTDFTIAIVHSGLQINLIFTGDGPSTGIFYLIYVTKAFSAGKNQMSMNFRQFPSMNDSDNIFALGQLNYSHIWNSLFIPGKRYFIKAIPIHAASGFSGLPLKNNFIFSTNTWILNSSRLDFETILT